MHFKKEKLEPFIKSLEKRGYRKYVQHHKSEDYGMWKMLGFSVDEDGEKRGGYQVAFFVYDWTKYSQHAANDVGYDVGISFEFYLCMNGYVDRLDLSISDDKMTVEEFEKLCEVLYQKVCMDYLLRPKVKSKKKTNSKVEKFFLSTIEGLSIKLSEKHPNSIFYKKEGEVLIEQCKNGIIYIKDDGFWSVFKTQFNMDYEQIKAFTKNMFETHLKWEVSIVGQCLPFFDWESV